MENTTVLERYGYLTKEESLVSIDKKILPNTLVLEAPEPFPGFFNYYSETPADTKPLYIYLGIKDSLNLEDITRATIEIKKYFKPKFAAAFGKVYLHGINVNVIRLRDLDNYDLVPELQERFLNEGVEMQKKLSKKIDSKYFIKLKKFFYLKPLDEGIYIDDTEEDQGYIKIPKKLKWDDFIELTKKVKHNWEGSKFDAAMAHFHDNRQITDLVRIYNNKMSLDYLKGIQKKFHQYIK